MPQNLVCFWKCSAMKLLPWSWRSARPRAAPAERWPNCWRTAMASAWVASKRVPRFVTCQPRNSAFQCSATPKIQTLPCWTVVTWVASIAHMTFGAVVMICRSWLSSSLRRARWGESRAFSRMRRRRRLRETRMASRTRRRAQTLRWPSPVQGEVSRSRLMAASRASSVIAGLGPRRAGGAAGRVLSGTGAWAA